MTERGQAGTWRYYGMWDGGTLAAEQTLAALPASDLDAARLITGERPGQLHYAQAQGDWYAWDGRCHARAVADIAGQLVLAFAADMEILLAQLQASVRARALAQLPGGASEAAARQAAEQAWKPYESAARYAAGLRRSAGLSALRSVLQVACSCDDRLLEDRNPRMLNFANGTADLATGQMKAHDPADMITYCLEYEYRPAARCPQFARFARRVCGGDEDVFRFLMLVLGYCLTGANPERRIFFLSGETSSGKSVLTDIMHSLLGPLFHPSQATLITLTRHGRNARVMNSVRGKRLIAIAEASAFMTIDEGHLKTLTGERRMAIDQHYARTEIDAPVTWTIIVVTNEMPGLTSFDSALRERILVIPGGPAIPAGERDTHLGARLLAAEAEGILAALVAASVEYYRSGLTVPLVVAMETEKYAEQQNTVTEYLRDCFTQGPAAYPAGGSVARRDVWDGYVRWAGKGPKLGRNKFFEQFGAIPGVSYNPANRRFEGISWNPDNEYHV
jgi:P4 family phage/plasmid primase-like protien